MKHIKEMNYGDWNLEDYLEFIKKQGNTTKPGQEKQAVKPLIDPEDEWIFYVYVVLYWYWDGDGYLSNQYLDCFLNEEESKKFAKNMMDEYHTRKIYLPGEPIPNNDGGDGPGFIQIISKKF